MAQRISQRMPGIRQRRVYLRSFVRDYASEVRRVARACCKVHLQRVPTRITSHSTTTHVARDTRRCTQGVDGTYPLVSVLPHLVEHLVEGVLASNCTACVKMCSKVTSVRGRLDLTDKQVSLSLPPSFSRGICSRSRFVCARMRASSVQ